MALNWLQDENFEMKFVQKVLEPHEAIIVKAIMQAWQSWEYLKQIDDGNLFKPLEARTRASFIHDLIRDAIKQKFENVSGVSTAEHLGFFILNFSNLVLLRFKMLDSYLQASNIPTQRQQDYDNQQELPDLPQAAIRAIAGYQLDRSQTKISDILITRPVGKNIRWNYSLLNSGVYTLQPSLVENNHPSQVSQPEKRRVKAKKLKDLGD